MWSLYRVTFTPVENNRPNRQFYVRAGNMSFAIAKANRILDDEWPELAPLEEINVSLISGDVVDAEDAAREK